MQYQSCLCMILLTPLELLPVDIWSVPQVTSGIKQAPSVLEADFGLVRLESDYDGIPN